MNNNPVRYNDPTGHKVCGNMNQNSECDIVEEKFTKLLDYVETKISRKNGGIQKKYTTLEAMGLVLNKAASIYGKIGAVL